MTSEPVSNDENRQVGHHALCADALWQDHVSEVEQLRARQASYLNALPSQPKEAIAASLKILGPDHGSYPAGFEDAMHFSLALQAMLGIDEACSDGPLRDATLYLAERVATSLVQVRRDLGQISDILSNPARIEREAKRPRPEHA